jgi:hypothetical protein
MGITRSLAKVVSARNDQKLWAMLGPLSRTEERIETVGVMVDATPQGTPLAHIFLTNEALRVAIIEPPFGTERSPRVFTNKLAEIVRHRRNPDGSAFYWETTTHQTTVQFLMPPLGLMFLGKLDAALAKNGWQFQPIS